MPVLCSFVPLTLAPVVYFFSFGPLSHKYPWNGGMNVCAFRGTPKLKGMGRKVK